LSQRPYRSPDGQAVGSIDNDEQGNDCPHPQDQVDEVGGCLTGCCTDYRCKTCGKKFRFEWPD
jgi:hypothetical protein